MVGKILNAKSKTIGTAAILLGAASLASRLFGLVRDRLLAGTFGAGTELDAYYAAFRIPDLVYSMFVFGAISAGFIPVFARFSEEGKDSDRGASDLVSRIISLMGLLLLVFAGLGMLLAPVYTPFITPGFSPEQLALTVRLTRVMFLSLILLGVSGVLGAILQVRKRFLVYSLAPILYNIGIIGGVLFLAPHWGVMGVAWGVVSGAAMHFLIQAWACRDIGLKMRFLPDHRQAAVGEVVRLTVPRVASLAVGQVNLLVVTSMLTALGAGSLAIYNFANNLIYVPINLIGVSVAVAAFPFISELAQRGETGRMVDQVNRAVRTIFFFAIPATVAFLLLRAQIVRVVLGSGRFDWNDTVITADALAYFSLGLFAAALLPLLTRAFFAVKDAMTPLVVNLAAVVLCVAFSWLAVRRGYGVIGVAAAISLANALNLVGLWVSLRVKLGDLGEGRLVRTVGVMSLCGLAMAAAMQTVKITLGAVVDMRSFIGIFSQGAAAGLVGLGAYAGLALALGSSEAKQALDMIRRRLRPSPAPVAVSQGEGSLEPEP